MAKRNSTRRKARKPAKSAAVLDKCAEAFQAQRAQLTAKQVKAIEATFTGLDDGRTRRTALATLGRSGRQLIKAIADERESAIAFASVVKPISDYAVRLRSFADWMDTASTRLGIALCWREDMAEIMREVANHG